MEEELKVERVAKGDRDVIDYLGKDVVRNALDIWGLEHESEKYRLHVCRRGKDIKAHLSTYNTPEAIYVSLGGEELAADSLLSLVPTKAVLTTTKELGDLVKRKLKFDVIYHNDLMVVNREEETLRSPERASRLSSEFDNEYATFGSSFNAPQVPVEWIREGLNKNFIFGTFDNGKLASVASLVAWLPQVAVIMGVETKFEFRRRGFARIAVSAAVQEGLRRSQACGLFVRSDNQQAIALYRSLGFKKYGEELWIDIGTGLIP
ncbi:MAG: GNAT family N-acetyltransferase [archaeon]|nr:GNAT family N-acetyltransferase [archaeon]